MGKGFYAIVIAVICVGFGMLIFPVVKTIVDAIDVSSFLPINKVGMIVLSYGGIFFMFYAAYKAFNR